ncbi:hypothetical protein ACFYTQ_35240 [Nocardia sp. NPDC004068]|uniref:hypothetical protein n=1 Tax=Nocardia sp. NPDC004068 TaxID=3364303 RepID=UPI0036A0ECE8
MTRRKFILFASLLLLFVAGCQNKDNMNEQEPKPSMHSMQELCDLPKPFFAERFHVANVVATSDLRPLTAEIGTIGGCTYQTEDKRYLGNIILRYSSAAAPSTSTGRRAGRTVRIDNVAVTEFIEPVPSSGAPDSQSPITLAASFQGWDGELGYYAKDSTDDATLRTGAQTLVNALRTLTN